MPLKEFGCKEKKINRNLEQREEIPGKEYMQDMWEAVCMCVCFF